MIDLFFSLHIILRPKDWNHKAIALKYLPGQYSHLSGHVCTARVGARLRLLICGSAWSRLLGTRGLRLGGGSLLGRAAGRRGLLARRFRGGGPRDGAPDRHFGVVGRGGVPGQVGRDLDLLRFQLRDLGRVVGALGGEFRARFAYGARGRFGRAGFGAGLGGRSGGLW